MKQVPVSQGHSKTMCKQHAGTNLVLMWMFSCNQGHIYHWELSCPVTENRLSHLTLILILFVMGSRSSGQLILCLMLLLEVSHTHTHTNTNTHTHTHTHTIRNICRFGNNYVLVQRQPIPKHTHTQSRV